MLQTPVQRPTRVGKVEVCRDLLHQFLLSPSPSVDTCPRLPLLYYLLTTYMYDIQSVGLMVHPYYLEVVQYSKGHTYWKEEDNFTREPANPWQKKNRPGDREARRERSALL